MSKLAPVQVAWLAGLLEGEAYFGVQKRPFENRRPCLRVKLEMTDLDIVKRAAVLVNGKSNISVYTRPPTNDGKSIYLTVFRIIWSGCDAERVMRLVLPYMGERRSAKIRECLATPNLSHIKRKVST